jgi:hypothetical protein
MAVGLLLILRPRWVDWLNYHINLRGYKPRPEKDAFNDLLAKQSRIYRRLLPLGIILIGLGWLYVGLTRI